MALSAIEQDYRRYSRRNGNLWRYCYKALSNAGFKAVLLYRLGVWFKKYNLGLLASLSQRMMHHACHCWISILADIGPGFLIAHVGGIVIGESTRIGSNCDIRQNVTFGGNFNKVREDGGSQPWVGDNVSVGVGAAILGPVRVGSNSIIGANSVVTRDVPENVIVFGVPARILKERWSEEFGRRL